MVLFDLVNYMRVSLLHLPIGEGGLSRRIQSGKRVIRGVG